MKTFVLVVLLLNFSISFAGNNETDKPKTFSVTGKVMDNNENLTGVKVVLDNKEVTVYTDFDGNFTIKNVPLGNHTLSLSLVTYNNKNISFNPANSKNLQIKLNNK